MDKPEAKEVKKEVSLEPAVAKVHRHAPAGSYKSRKFVLVIFGCLLSVFCGCLAVKWPLFAPNLPTVIGAIIAIIGLYFGANVSSEHIQNKINTVSPKETTED